MTIREIIENTIAYANGVTGGNNPDLTGAVKALGEGFGSGGNGEAGTGKTEMQSGSFTPSEPVEEYTLTMPSPISNFIYRLNPVTLDGGVKTNVAGVVAKDFPYIGLTTNTAGTSLSGLAGMGAKTEISEDGLSVTIRRNSSTVNYLISHNYDWIAW